MSGHLCPDCQRCPACGRSAWCEGDRILVVPCEHHGYCGDCNLENCTDCRAEAEREMWEGGVYNARVDPLYDHTHADAAAKYRDRLDEWLEESGFDPMTNSYKHDRRGKQ